MAIRSLVDGGSTDDTGIACAVAAGATQIFVVLNFGTDSGSDNCYKTPGHLTKLFAGASDLSASDQILLPVFKHPCASDVQTMYSTFDEVQGSKYLEGMRI